MVDDIKKAFSSAHQRLLLLDYDGTLAELKPLPSQAVPTPSLLQTLEVLGKNPHTTVVVISGRKHQELDAWLGALPVWLVAEHGLLMKQPGGDWHTSVKADTKWMPEVHAVMDRYTRSVNGSLTEEKTSALVWHWRNAANDALAVRASKKLFDELYPLCAAHQLKLMTGKDVIEVQSQGFDKGTAATHWVTQANWDFILAAGDDTTDEDTFKALPGEAITIKVGTGDTNAGSRLTNPAMMRELLAGLATISPSAGR